MKNKYKMWIATNDYDKKSIVNWYYGTPKDHSRKLFSELNDIRNVLLATQIVLGTTAFLLLGIIIYLLFHL